MLGQRELFPVLWGFCCGDDDSLKECSLLILTQLLKAGGAEIQGCIREIVNIRQLKDLCCVENSDVLEASIELYMELQRNANPDEDRTYGDILQARLHNTMENRRKAGYVIICYFVWFYSVRCLLETMRKRDVKFGGWSDKLRRLATNTVGAMAPQYSGIFLSYSGRIHLETKQRVGGTF
jgi:hypothetical protein